MSREYNNYSILILTILMALGGIIWWILYSIKEYHSQDDPMLHNIKQILEPLHPAIKHIKLYKGSKSYTINKDKIYLCLKDENNEYYPENFLLYVCIHEIAHFLNKDDIGHTEKFHDIFDELLEKAHALGIYNPSIPLIQNYCMHT